MMKKNKLLSHVMVFLLIVAMVLPIMTPVSAYAAEDLYLAYQNDENGTSVVKLDNSSRKMYRIDELCMNVGEQVDLCFINATFWTNPQWTSSDNNVIQVNRAGVVTAVAPGVAQVTLTYSKWWGEKVSATAMFYVGEENWELYSAQVELTQESQDKLVTEKMDKLFAIVGNKYFTTTQDECMSSREKVHGCEKCKVSKVIEVDWFTTAFEDFGAVNCANFPQQHLSESKTNYDGYSCYGFTLFAQYYVFATDSSQKLTLEEPIFGNFTKSFAKENMKPGDVIRLKYGKDYAHSALVYSVEEDGVVVIDCNGNGSQLNCLVEKRKLLYTGSYSGKSVIIDRVATEATVTPSPTLSANEKYQYGYYHYTDGKGDYAVCSYYGQYSQGENGWKNVYREEIWVDEPLELVSTSATSYKHPEGSGCSEAGCLEGDFWTAGGKFVDEEGVSWYRQQIRIVTKNINETQSFTVIKEVPSVSVSDEVLQDRMEELVDKLLAANRKVDSNATKAYFTTTGKIYKADDGTTCKNTEVVKADWFKKEDAFGTVNVDNFPKHLPSKGNPDSNIGYSCFGFACFAQWYIYKESNDEKVTAKQVATGTYNKEFLTNNLQTGDVIRIYISKEGSYYYHSMVFHSFTKDGMMVLDSNRGGDNQVRLSEVKYNRDGWSNDPVWIYRVEE